MNQYIGRFDISMNYFAGIDDFHAFHDLWKETYRVSFLQFPSGSDQIVESALFTILQEDVKVIDSLFGI